MPKRVASVDTNVLILGEVGVGKEEIAKFVYKNSLRKSRILLKLTVFENDYKDFN
ncbi:sigma 54-interacting transcriptional regulator [Clostridium estertheticum]|uniref:sigma 54-interacting transcriptional regulator n=1 Tax=Clostridium estertheticum TaxID=238834 RepID=UPI001C7DF07B|nr:sigma 54-interacting transcriptional regulator [Clostridium estertheticum]MBX4265996.1 sigma-54 factor interaction domain-containing protein [Clostridium estertheticum]MBX4268733.1 sigma-54 factor interaction domain-containing protein [Clostridium estertheticum]WLC79070.1 sigma-54 factor interaction domain-containing protein [Clostridium estertheticum]WLC90089.1 sigma-54 factor interaction domain-containing protein [Clostridium estertheticum]